MDYRYVYRGIEERIGTPLQASHYAPHVALTYALRRDYRELRDSAKCSEARAVCLASIAGNGKLDAVKMSEAVFEYLDEVQAAYMPYVVGHARKKEENSDGETGEYEESFALLEQFKKELEAKRTKDQKTEQDSKALESGTG